MPHIVSGTRPSSRILSIGGGDSAPVGPADSDTQIGRRFLLSLKEVSTRQPMGYYVRFDNVFGERFETKTFLEANRAAEFRRLR